MTLNLRTARARGVSSPRRTKNLDKKLPRMALKAQQTSYQTQSRPGELNPVHPQFDEEFSFLIYDLGQELVAVLYDQVCICICMYIYIYVCVHICKGVLLCVTFVIIRVRLLLCQASFLGV